jgi:CheY-like chemotaxis protein
MPDAKIKLLIVDDQISARISLAHIFMDLGYEVRCAEDGFSALVKVREEFPDVILSDLNMPGMSGFEFLSVVRRRFPVIRVIAMSGAFSGDSIPQGVASDAFYEKGTHLGTLLKIVEAVSYRESPSILQPLGPSAPIWIARNGHDPNGEAYVMITCPECLRAFPQTLDEAICAVQETACVHCYSSIHYAIVQPMEPASPPVLQRKPGAEIPTALGIPSLVGSGKKECL